MGDEPTLMPPDPSRSRKGGSGGSPPKQPSEKVTRFWNALLQMFGTRWTTSYGQTPSEIWILAIESLSAKELRTASRALLANASAHPPTLPEFMALARIDSPKKSQRFPEPFTPAWHELRRDVMASSARQSRERKIEWTDEQRRRSNEAMAEAERPENAAEAPQYSHAEKAVGRWFVFHATRYRWVGMKPPAILELRRQCISAADLLLPHLEAGDPDMPQEAITGKLDEIAEGLYPSALAAQWLADHPVRIADEYRH